MKRAIAAPALFGLLCTISGPALSQELPVRLDTVRVTVTSRAGQLLGASTRSVDVLDRQMLLNSPATTVVEALQWGFGLDLMPRSPALVDVGIRGSSFEQVLVLVDGVRMRDAQTGHFNLNLAVPLEQVERIEILRGAAASLYGSDAMGGVINVVTRKSGQSTAATVAAGSFDRKAATLSHRQLLRGLVADVAGSVDRSDGHRPGTDHEMGLGRVAFQLPVGQHEISVEAAHAERKFGAGGFYGNFPSFETTRTTTAGIRASLVPGASFSLEPSLRLRRGSDDFILYRDEPARYRNRHSTFHLGGDLIGRAALSERLDLAAGLHAYRDQVRSATLGDHNETTAGGSLELAVGGGPGATGTLGLRIDRVPSGDVEIAPGASVAWQPASLVRFRSSVGRAFRNPTWTERFYRDPANEGSATLTPERAWSADAGVDLFPHSALRFSTVAFVRDATDLIDWARPEVGTDQIWRTRNVEEARFEGIETEVELSLSARTRLRAQGSWLSVSSSASPGFLSKYALRPQVESVALSIQHSLFDALNVYVRGARERRSGEEDHFRLDGRLALDVRQVRLFADLQNATDSDYMDITLQPAAGRNLMLGLELRPFSR